jgi:predicted RNA-binding protein YlqC (UPF0109 family)
MVTSPLPRRGSRQLSRSEVDRLVDQNSCLRAEVERLEHELTQAKTEVVVRDAEVEKLVGRGGPSAPRASTPQTTI